MSSFSEQLVRRWGDPEINGINRHIHFLSNHVFKGYEPTANSSEFLFRFDKWLRSAPNDDDVLKAMFRAVTQILYVGLPEFYELYRLAFTGPITRWLIETSGIDICSPNVHDQLRAAASETWFCPITDSLRINAFFHVNQLPATNDMRPEFRSLSILSKPELAIALMRRHGLKRVVLLEDFVGGGSQVAATINFLSKFPVEVTFLIVPLIICPSGMEALAKFATDQVQLSPVLALPQSAFVSETPKVGEPEVHETIRAVAFSTYRHVAGPNPSEHDAPYHPLGFPAQNPTGGLIVMYSNTPDNTIPMIHFDSPSWAALFPRHRRI